jgi:hypothetical protein
VPGTPVWLLVTTSVALRGPGPVGLKLTMVGHQLPGATGAWVHAETCWKSAPAAPATASWVMWRSSGPSLKMASARWVGGLPTAWLPNARLPGEKRRAAARPWPCSLTSRTAPLLWTTRITASRGPARIGAKVTSNLHTWPGPRTGWGQAAGDSWKSVACGPPRWITWMGWGNGVTFRKSRVWVAPGCPTSAGG